MFEQFLDWEWDILHSGSLEKMQAALRGVLGFLRGFIAEKEANPDEFLTSAIVHGTIEGRPVTEEEKIGMVWFLWLGGLDTVAATISQMYRRMALQPEIQNQIRDNPELINGAVEEFLRTQPILSSGRRATRDFEWHGIQVKAGDSFSCLNPAGNFDPAFLKERQRALQRLPERAQRLELVRPVGRQQRRPWPRTCAICWRANSSLPHRSMRDSRECSREATRGPAAILLHCL